jgi:hypothetical protein
MLISPRPAPTSRTGSALRDRSGQLHLKPNASTSSSLAVAQVVVDLELDRRELDAAHVVDQLGERRGPSARLPAEDRLERLTLGLVGALVDEEPHRRLGLGGPDISLERADRDGVQAIERYVP